MCTGDIVLERRKGEKKSITEAWNSRNRAEASLVCPLVFEFFSYNNK